MTGRVGMAEERPTHRPVMADEVLTALAPAAGKWLLDGTLGMGGHSLAWLEACGGSRLVAFDRDRSAVASARERLLPFGERATLLHADYRNAVAEITKRELPQPDAVLLDLGLGSHQLDDRQRGFSFRFDAPLDMRYDRDRPGPTAAEILAQSSESELLRILSEFGEEQAARKLARRIVNQRRLSPIRTTQELATLVRECVGTHLRRKKIDPCTKTFQALRIATNRELEGLSETIESLARLLKPGGRIAIIAFHSLEDRVVKRTMRALAPRVCLQPGDDPRDLPERLLEMPNRKALVPSEQEIAINPRARSAKLRWGIRI